MSDNEKTVLKQKLMSIVSSLEVMDEEKENIKEILKDLKESHQIKPKVARTAAKILHNPGKKAEMDEEAEVLDALLQKLS